ncbi:cytochrome P450 [Ornithinimicrobium tianjinense]|uniref:Cytochrome P450 n=1 Tax=Ornithinimicrobium tianjinense TaxID=1195761 RepID=A0A917F280_9MICO|nr:cytochrome P450 [Ornithinimicrobium tianjinense]GGF41169.1 cytochrome P450 [Ornithinimicrobium tianjinense]
MSGCPVTRGAPLAHELRTPGVYPDAVRRRYRAVEDPAEVREVLRRADDFAPTNALSYAVPLTPDSLRALARVGFALPPVLASATGPAHLAVRRVVAGCFSPARVRAQEPTVRTLTRAACDRVRGPLAAGATVDLATEVAAHVPPTIMERLTGVGAPPRDRLTAWGRRSLELFWGWPDAERQLVLARSAADFYVWLREAVSDAAAAEDGNLVAALAEAGVEQRQIRSLAYFLTIAGQETTTMLLQTVLATALHQGAWEAAGRSERAAGEVVRDVLATASSVPTWRREVVADTEVGGRAYAAGEELVLHLSGVGLAGDPGLAFGHGVHRCLGAGLAEREAQLVLHETARALPDLQPAEAELSWSHLLSFQHVDRVLARSPRGMP